LNDGAALDVEKGSWRNIPKPPLSVGIYHPGAIQRSSEVIVAGTPCGETASAHDEAECKPGGDKVLAYSLSDDSWRSIPPPSDLRAEKAPASMPIEWVPLGTVGSDVIFSVSGGTHANGLLRLTAGDDWQWIDPPVAGTDAVCPTGSNLVAVRTGGISDDGLVTGPPADTQDRALEFWIMPSGSNSWSEMRSVDKGIRDKPTFESVTCGNGSLVYEPIMPPPAGLSAGLLKFNDRTEQFDALPPLEAVGFPSQPTVAESGSEFIFWTSDGDNYYTLPGPESGWSSHSKPVAGSVRLRSGEGFVVADPTFDQRPPDELEFWLATAGARSAP
jgi:hypothetical protein